VKPRWIVALLAAVAAVGGLLLLLSMEPGTAGQPDLVDPEQAPERRVRVEVLNAAGVAGLARTATNRLRDRGFDVVYYGNARSLHPDSSWVIDRVGDPAVAHHVARTLGISRVASRPDPDLYLEVTVVLGTDWEGAGEKETSSD
jgi:hypothetical protein